MKQKILLSRLSIMLILLYSISCQKSINENLNPPIDNTDSTDTTTNHCDTTIIGTDTCIKCNDTCVKCANICNTDTTKPLVFYLDPNGSDDFKGNSPDSALRTINAVQEKLIKYYPVLHQDVEVRIRFISIKPYTGQKVRWTYYSPIHTISFMPSDYKYGYGIDDIADRPVFSGEGKIEDYFFRLIAQVKEKTNIRFYYIKIRGYSVGGIQFYGGDDKDGKDTWNGYNTVYGCYFDSIGNKWNSKLKLGYGGIDTWNSDYNTIQLNHFVHCENASGDDASHVHGVYIAFHSEHNLIDNNNFSWISGDPIRVRDYSNYNVVTNNDIKRCGKYAYFSGYRYHDGSTGYIECRSWQNEFSNNNLACGYNGQKIKEIAFYYKYDPDGTCKDGCSDPGDQHEDSPSDPDGTYKGLGLVAIAKDNVEDCR